MDHADIERAAWMEAADLRILAYLYRHEGEIHGPATIAKNIRRTDGERYNADYINHRLRILVDAGILEKPSRGNYRITETGISYAEGEIEPTELKYSES